MIRTFAKAAAITAIFSLGISTAHAQTMPTIPDNHPAIPNKSQAQEHTKITVTDEAGKPLTGPVHRGDVILVHGTGFDPNANKGGFPIPVPPGTPNGVFVIYSAFPDHWKPSENAPESARKNPHDRSIAWMMPPGTLEAIPTMPVNFRRSIARQTQPMNTDGTFTARLVVDPPEQTPGNNWGVYVYAGAGSVNASEETYVPIPFSTAPGRNTPPAATPDFDIDAITIAQFTKTAGGSISTKNGAARNGNRVTFSKEQDRGDGIIRYRGTAVATARYNVVETAFANPWLEPRGNGTWAVTVEVSTAPDVGTDSVARREIGTVTGTTGSQTIAPLNTQVTLN